jgi:ATP-dependent protease ClpP protease subunit
MFEDRIIFLGVLVDDASANDVMAQLLTLESADPDRDILMYINSPGGSFTATEAKDYGFIDKVITGATQVPDGAGTLN